MDKALHYWTVAKALYVWFSTMVAPWLVGFAIPSVVAALSEVPKTEGIRAFLLKACRFIGVLTHKNEDGTMKAPLGLGAIFQGLKSALGLALVACLLFSTSCASLSNHPKVSAMLDCAVKGIEESLPEVMGDVLAALDGGSPDWGALGDLEKAHGLDVIGCAVNALIQGAQQASSDPTMGMMAHKMASRVAVNGAAYLKARGMVVK